MNIGITIPGRPTPKARPRMRAASRQVYTPSAAAEEAAAMAMLPHRGKLKNEPRIRVAFFFHQPHASADLDNLIKLYLDSLVKADVFGDDRKVKAVWAEVRDDGPPRTVIDVSPWR